MDQDKRVEYLFDLLRRPFPYDPIPDWVIRDDKVYRQFVQLDYKFMNKVLELYQQHIQEKARIAGL